MPTGKQRAQAARQAYKVTLSPGGEYSLRGFIRDAYGARAAKAVGRSLVRSAAQPGKAKTFVNYGGRRAQVLPRRSDISYAKMGRIMSSKITFGEYQGAAANVEKTYRRNLRRS